MRSTGNDFLHYFLYFGQLVHQIQFIMQTTCRIDNYHIGIIGSCGTQCVKSDRSRVSTHFLLYNRHTYPFTPYHQLLHSSSTESIGSTQINGFAGFLIPAVLMLIIQQTLLLGIGLSAGTARETNRFRDLVPLSRHYHGTLRIVLGKSLTYFMIYVIMSIYMLCLVPKMFSLVQIAQAGTLFAFVLPYILACIFFAMTCSIFIHHREACMMIYVFTSVPLLFISGISWPGSAIPEFWKVVSWIFPSTFGINGFVRINNMGATLPDVATEYHALWLQAGIYFLTTCIVYRRQITLSRTHVYARLKEIKNRHKPKEV